MNQFRLRSRPARPQQVVKPKTAKNAQRTIPKRKRNGSRLKRRILLVLGSPGKIDDIFV